MSLLEMVKEAGVVGAGGAGFPTHAKLSAKAEYILLNGAECEPLLRVDQQLMELFPEEIIRGLEAAGRFVGASKALIGIKGKHKEVVEVLRKRIAGLSLTVPVDVKELEDIYPAGDEQVLVYELTGRVVPEGGLPVHVGCVVINSETALNIYKATKGEAVTEKYITVAGDIPRPVTVKVPVGTPLLEVLKLGGLESLEGYGVIDGGPMMGPVLKDLRGHVTKKTKGLVVLKKGHNLIRRKSLSMEQMRRVNRTSCEQCRMCTDMCPRYLLGHNTEPHKMMRVINYNLDSDEGQKIAYLCCQCNLCELFACPVGLYPKAANLYVRQKLVEEGIRFSTGQKHWDARKSRSHRLLPSKRLIARLGLKNFDQPAPLIDTVVQPQLVYIGISQHVGAPAIPVVKSGDYVQKGQLIGKIPENSLGANIHASISGTIVEVGKDFIAIRGDNNG